MTQAGRNGSAVMTYTSTNVIIQNNTIHTSDGGIFVKGSDLVGQFWTIRRNLVYGIRSDGSSLVASARQRVAGAVVARSLRTSGSGIAFIGYRRQLAENVTIADNTLYNNTAGLFFKPNTAGYRNIRVYSNISRTRMFRCRVRTCW